MIHEMRVENGFKRYYTSVGIELERSKRFPFLGIRYTFTLILKHTKEISALSFSECLLYNDSELNENSENDGRMRIFRIPICTGFSMNSA